LIDAPGPQEDWKKGAIPLNLTSEIKWTREYLPDEEIKEKVKKAADINQIWSIILQHLKKIILVPRSLNHSFLIAWIR